MLILRHFEFHAFLPLPKLDVCRDFFLESSPFPQPLQAPGLDVARSGPGLHPRRVPHPCVFTTQAWEATDLYSAPLLSSPLPVAYNGTPSNSWTTDAVFWSHFRTQLLSQLRRLNFWTMMQQWPGTGSSGLR